MELNKMKLRFKSIDKSIQWRHQYPGTESSEKIYKDGHNNYIYPNKLVT